MEEQEQIDITKLKYVLYARKSTTDETRQVRSIDDQIADCKEYARRNGLHVVSEVLKETKSAKLPSKRPVFNQMLKDVRAGKYDGILAWNPDRLARNMLEGGMIIDMIDNGIIKDLKFYNHTFTKDANGKMLLGMAFVLSKQYSDDLSQKVTRGVRRSLQEGKTAIPKHGYLRDADGRHRPDGKNFLVIKKAWQMRKEGHALEAIAEWMNQQGYGRTIKRTGKQIDMDKRILSDIFHDSFYYGVLVQASQTVDLRELYDFVQAVSKEDYDAIQRRFFDVSMVQQRKRFVPYPFKHMIICSFCGNEMRTGASAGHGGSFLYYRCSTVGCTRKKKSIRAKVILDFIYQLLEHGLQFTDKEYEQYYEETMLQADQLRERVQQELHRQRGILSQLNAEIKERSLAMGRGNVSETVKDENNKRVTELAGQRETLDESIEKLEAQVAHPEEDRLTVEEFLNLSKNAATIVKAGDAMVKDTICRYILLNLTVDEEKVLSYQAKEPFATLLKRRQVHTSRG